MIAKTLAIRGPNRGRLSCMGLFRFFSTKLGRKNSLVSSASIPTVNVTSSMMSVYAKVFYEVMADVDGFTPEEFDEVLHLVMDDDGDFMNMARYGRPIFENYFLDRYWTWAEYDYWERTYAQIGSAPLRFPSGIAVPLELTTTLTADQVLKRLTLAELKSFIESQGGRAPPKAKKRDLFDLAQSLPDLQLTKLWIEAQAQLKGDIGYPLYLVLMRHIAFKTKATFDRERALKTGVAEFKHLYVEAGDERFVKLALIRNPEALPPYFPGDVTLVQPIIPGFE